MIWENWSDFFAMGGYAKYVWGSLIMVAGLMLGEVALLRARGKAIRAQLRNPRTRTGEKS